MLRSLPVSFSCRPISYGCIGPMTRWASTANASGLATLRLFCTCPHLIVRYDYPVPTSRCQLYPPRSNGRLGCSAERARIVGPRRYVDVMNWKLEVVFLPVTDVDRAKAFYVDQVGFHADHDQRVSESLRFVQLTPPGSACSVAFGEGITAMAPGSQKGLQCVV